MFFLFAIFDAHKCGVLLKTTTVPLRVRRSHGPLLYHYNETNNLPCPIAQGRTPEEVCRSSAIVHPQLAEELTVFESKTTLS